MGNFVIGQRSHVAEYDAKQEEAGRCSVKWEGKRGVLAWLSYGVGAPVVVIDPRPRDEHRECVPR